MNTSERLVPEGSPRGRIGVTRATLCKRVALGFSALSAGGAAAAGLASASGASKATSPAQAASASPSSRDREILQFALKLEHLQTAFYADALRAGKLTGEVRQFAEVVGHEEQAHLAYLQRALGSAAVPAQTFRFGEATASDKLFVAAAVTLEETGLAAYNGQAENLSRGTLRSVARVMSVEARHAAWARGLAGEAPAPVPADVPISAATALKAIQPYLA